MLPLTIAEGRPHSRIDGKPPLNFRSATFFLEDLPNCSECGVRSDHPSGACIAEIARFRVDHGDATWYPDYKREWFTDGQLALLSDGPAYRFRRHYNAPIVTVPIPKST